MGELQVVALQVNNSRLRASDHRPRNFDGKSCKICAYRHACMLLDIIGVGEHVFVRHAA